MALVKILVVTDEDGGYRRSAAASHKFHIGEFVKVLQDTDWLGFTVQITRAHRSADPSPGTPQASHPIGADLYGFRFNTASLDGYDMCFFLSIARKSEDPVFDDNARKSEAAAIAAFMENGGGFFAAGDHEDLGASINQHVPRVRSMRRWAYSTTGPHGGPIAPSGTEGDRHDTLLAGSDSGTSGGSSYPYQFNDQSDALPQTIAPKTYPYYAGRWFRKTLPHPLLCCPLGRIDVLPDHMHEGWCEVPANLGRNEDLPGRAGKVEYPLASDGTRIEPEVIAEADVYSHETLNQEFAGGSFEISPMTTDKTFGVIAAYDGHLADIGRVVVDATWHHFVNINLIGTSASYPGMNPTKAKGFYSGAGDTPVPAYEKIMWYYRNLVYWLIPKRRRRHLWLDELSIAVRLNPRWEEFNRIPRDIESLAAYDLRAIIGYAQLAEEYFNSVRGYCAHYHLLPIVLEPIWRFDPHIWESLIPELEPWNPRAEALSRKITPIDVWRQSLLPDPHLLRRVALGTLVLATVFHLRRFDTADEKTYGAVQRLALDLLPRHLEVAAAALDESVKAIRQTSAQFATLAAAARKSAAQKPAGPKPTNPKPRATTKRAAKSSAKTKAKSGAKGSAKSKDKP